MKGCCGPYICPRESQILARFGLLSCLAHVIDINSLTVLGGNASTAREKTSLKEGNCDCWRTGFWGGRSSFRGVASGAQLTGAAGDCKNFMPPKDALAENLGPAVQFIPH